MPALPWTSLIRPEPDRDYLVVASSLPLSQYRRVPAFLRASFAVRRQLQTSPGLVGFAMDADLIGKTFQTLSVWRDEAAMSAFVLGRPHAEIMQTFRAQIGDARIVTWTARGARPDWHDARRRLAAS